MQLLVEARSGGLVVWVWMDVDRAVAALALVALVVHVDGTSGCHDGVFEAGSPCRYQLKEILSTIPYRNEKPKVQTLWLCEALHIARQALAHLFNASQQSVQPVQKPCNTPLSTPVHSWMV